MLSQGVLNSYKEGKNILAALVLRYPYDGSNGNYGMIRTQTPGFYLREKNGNLVADSSFRAKKNPDFRIIPEAAGFSPMQIYEQAFGNNEFQCFMRPDFDASKWEKAMEYPYLRMRAYSAPGNIRKRTIPHMIQTPAVFGEISAIPKSLYRREEWLSFLAGKAAIMVPAGTSEIVEISAGEEMTGYLEMGISGGRGSLTIESLLYIMGLQYASAIAGYLGRKDMAAEYAHRAKQVQEAVNRYCRDDNGFYQDGPGIAEYSAHAQVFAILTETVSPAEGKRLLEAALKDKVKFFRWIEEGDEITCKVYQQWLAALVHVIYNLKMTVDPEKIVIGGGVSRNPRLISDLREEYEKTATLISLPYLRHVDIDRCHYTADANMIGAVYNWMNSMVK